MTDAVTLEQRRQEERALLAWLVRALVAYGTAEGRVDRPELAKK